MFCNRTALGRVSSVSGFSSRAFSRTHPNPHIKVSHRTNLFSQIYKETSSFNTSPINFQISPSQTRSRPHWFILVAAALGLYAVTKDYLEYSKTSPPPSPESLADAFKLQLIDTANDERNAELFQEICETAQNWLDIYDRRLELENKNYEWDDCAEIFEMFRRNEYQTVVESIINISNDFHCFLDGKYASNRKIVKAYTLILRDQDDRIQAIAIVALEEIELFWDSWKDLEVLYIATAPWNININRKNDPLHDAYVVKGSGTTLMRQVYELAYAEDATKIKLESARFAGGFYKRIGMFNRNDQYYKYVDQFQPDSLNVASGNLLSMEYQEKRRRRMEIHQNRHLASSDGLTGTTFP